MAMSVSTLAMTMAWVTRLVGLKVLLLAIRFIFFSPPVLGLEWVEAQDRSRSERVAACVGEAWVITRSG